MKYFSQLTGGSGIGVAAALIASLSFAGEAQAQFTGPGTYVIEVAGTPPNTTQVLDIEWNSTISGAHVLRWAANNGANQKFTVMNSGYGGYTIRAVHSGLCLDLPFGATGIGTQPIQINCLGTVSQRFYIDSVGNGLHKIRSVKNGNRIFYAETAQRRVQLAPNGELKTGMKFRFRKI